MIRIPAFLPLVLFVVFSCTLGIAQDAYYYYENDQGTMVFSDTPFEKQAYKIKRIKKKQYIEHSYVPVVSKLRLAKIRDIIERESNKHNMDPSLIEAVIKAESAYNATAVSRKGARGLMQLMPQTAKDLGVSNVFDPDQNISGGTKLLSQLIKKYNGDLNLVLAAYNAGDKAVQKHQGIPPFTETKDYVVKVRKYYQNFIDLALRETDSNKQVSYP